MRWFKDIKIGYKMAIGFGLCLFLTVVIGAIGISRMSQLNHATKQIGEDALAGQCALYNMVNAGKQIRLLEYELRDNAGSSKTAISADIQTQVAAFNHAFDNYAKSVMAGEDAANTEELKRRWTAFIAVHDSGSATTLNQVYSKSLQDVVDQLNKMSDWNFKHGAELTSNASNAYSEGKKSIIIALVIAIALGTFVCRFISHTITEALKQISARFTSLNAICLANLNHAVKALAAGDLTSDIPTGTKLLEINSKDELGLMGEQINHFITTMQGTIFAYLEAQKSLNQLVGQAQRAADSIATGSNEVSIGNIDLSERTAEQASSLEETAASMEEMTATVKQNADNARQANQLAAQARAVAEEGGSVVHSAVASINEVSAASQRIADIITVIDEIAFQTNLLALNAAVEAARVGEQGRGFAVVAAEVRSLAGRSATAAKEIKNLVADTVAKVEKGSAQVYRSGATLEEIVLSVKKVADVIAEISAASQEQSAGIGQVNKAIMQMDEITQQNAALVEETTAASQSIAIQAQALQSLVAQFKLDASAAGTASAAVAPPVATAATGTYGGARRPLISSVRPAPKLTLSDMDDSSFDEF